MTKITIKCDECNREILDNENYYTLDIGKDRLTIYEPSQIPQLMKEQFSYVDVCGQNCLIKLIDKNININYVKLS